MACKCCKNKDFKKIAKFFRVLSDPNRLKLLCRLSKCECCVCEVEKDVNLSQNLVSHHLKVLRNSGLVDFDKNGHFKIYSVNEGVVNGFIEDFGKSLSCECSSFNSNK